MDSHAAQLRRPHRRERGVVIIIALLAMVLLAAVVMYVINMGRQVNERVVTQTAADADVKAGATWVARSYNTVAMNNVAMTRYIAAINTLDGLPTVTEAALTEQTAMRDALAARYGSVNTGNAALTNLVQGQFQLLLGQLNHEIDQLTPVDGFFNSGFDMRTITHYNGPTGRGRMWLAMQSLDEFNRVTMDNLGVLAQMSAEQAGRVNLQDRADNVAAMMLPLEPRTPWVRGHFHDFERPVKQGLLPGADDTGSIMADSVSIGLGQVDDPEIRRGPYDTVYGWRYSYWVPIQPMSAPTQAARVISQDFFGSPPTGQPPGNPPLPPDPTQMEQLYRTWGTHRNALNWMGSYASGNLYESRFATWFNAHANTKLRYLWNALPPRSMAMPQWSISYPLLDGSDVFSESAYFEVFIKSRYPAGHSQFLSSGSYNNQSGNSERPYIARLVRRVNWWLGSAPDGTLIADLQQYHAVHGTPQGVTIQSIITMSPYSWALSFRDQRYVDYDIGLYPVFDAQGNQVLQDRYMYRVLIYAGVNRHPVAAGVFDPAGVTNPGDATITYPVENPYTGFDPNAATAPAPTDFDHSLVPANDPAVRRGLLTFLGIARRDDHALMWPSAFKGGKPASHMVGLAQAGVFNDHSWDLWTPMWRSQLEPITDYESWVTLMENSSPAAMSMPVVDVNAYAELTDYLRSMDQLGPLMLEH